MKIAVAVENGQLAAHFGRCPEMMFFTIGERTREIIAEQILKTPPHEPGVFPAWIKEQGADVVLAGGMGPRAIALFEEAGISIAIGTPSLLPRDLVEAWLADELPMVGNGCHYGPDHHCEH